MQRIDIYDKYLTRIGCIQAWVSLLWTDSYNEGGSFQLEVIPSDAMSAILQPDNMVRYSETGTLMVIESVQTTYNQMVVNGKDAGHLLSRRCVWNRVYGTKNAESTIRSIFSSNISPWDGFELGDSAGLEQTFDAEYEAGEMEVMVQEIAQEADIGYRVVFNEDATKLLLECYAPEENPNAIYSPRYRNVGEITYTESYADYKNVCYVGAGDGFGNFAKFTTVGDKDATGPDRREMFLDAESGDEELTYPARGRKALKENAKINSLECTITGDASLGDIITIRVPDIGVTVKRRIKQIQITAQNGGIEKEYTVGDNILG